jgi:hypothetical protein
MSLRLTPTVACDRPTAAAAGGWFQHVVFRLDVASDAPVPAERPPLDLGVALDASWSMAFETFERARSAVADLVERLDARDSLLLATFSNAGQIVLRRRQMDVAGKHEAHRALRWLHPEGESNLFRGWSLAAQEVACARRDAAVGHVVVFSDGKPTLGIRQADPLAHLARACRQRGVGTSVVGVDVGDAALLQRFAHAGGGQCHDLDAERPSLDPLFHALGGLRGPVAKNVSLRLQLPRSARATVFGAWYASPTPTGLDLRIGGLTAGTPRTVVLRVELPEGTPPRDGLALQATVEGSPIHDGPAVSAATAIALGLASERHDAAAATHAARAVANAWHADILQHAQKKTDAYAFAELGAYLRSTRPAFSDYVARLPDGSARVDALTALLRTTQAAWKEEQRNLIPFGTCEAAPVPSPAA